MDNPHNPLSWACYQGKSMEELRHSLLLTTLELETTRLAAQEDIRRREDQFSHLQHLLSMVLRERDEAQNKYQRLLMEKLLLQQQQETALLSGNSSTDDEPGRVDSSTGISSDCEESIVSSPPPPPPPSPSPMAKLGEEKPLPEKGKMLEAVMKAGPLLQTLLLAGTLPRWQHPPPPLGSFEIPPMAISSPLAPPPAFFYQHRRLQQQRQ